MRSQAYCLAAAAALALSSGTLLPAHAGWGTDVGRAVLSSMVRQAANRIILQGMRQLNSSGYRSGSFSNSQSGTANFGSNDSSSSSEGYAGSASQNNYPPLPPPYAALPKAKSTHHSKSVHASASTGSGLKYPTDEAFVPPPPPSPVTLPDMPISAGSEYPRHSSSQLVPPPPPAPSLWDADEQSGGLETVSQSRQVIAQAGTINTFKRDFDSGMARAISWNELVANHVFTYVPIKGSVHKRQEPIKYVILHSTETAQAADARRVIQSWNNRGPVHPAAQFIVDRDGTICTTTDPANVTTHIDVSRSLPGYTNDNSVGIEIVRSGAQVYTRQQISSVVRLVAYLQDRYHLPDSSVTTHHHVQPSNRTDPVNFDMLSFAERKDQLRSIALPTPSPSDQSEKVATHASSAHRHRS